MPVTGGHMKITIRYTYLGQKCENVQFYRLTGTAFATATVLGVLEAYWNDIKTVFRSIFSTSEDVSTIDSILGDEVGGGLGFAEFSIPPDERVGTRPAADDGQWLNSFSAIGARLTVGSRVTRPGQKRFPSLREGDVIGNSLTPAIVDIYDPVFDIFAEQRVLGAPVATGVMQPEVGKSVPTGFPSVFQDVTGKVVNTNVTTQVSRKIGRGA